MQLGSRLGGALSTVHAEAGRVVRGGGSRARFSLSAITLLERDSSHPSVSCVVRGRPCPQGPRGPFGFTLL